MSQFKAKNLTPLQDQMIAESMACKKCDAYSVMSTDQCTKDLFCTLAQHHKDNFTKLFDYLNSHN